MRSLLLCLCAVAPIAAQAPSSSPTPDAFGSVVRTGVVFDGYYFGTPYAVAHIVEWTVPLVLSHRFGQRFAVDLSSAYAHAAAATTSGTLEVSGATDSDVRASWAAMPGHMIVTLVGTLPSGKRAVDSSAVPLLSALGTELLSFTTPGFVTGGGVTGGLATAFTVGERWSAGVGGSYRWRGSYTAVAGKGDVEPGGEGRLRFGLEGPVGGASYFRGAIVYAASGADTLVGGSRSVTGGRVLLYSGLSLPAGRGTLSLFAYDRYRFRPGGSDTTVARLPRGNVLGLGARLDRSLAPSLSLAPNLEIRHELTGSASNSLSLLGWLLRAGVDLRYRASGDVTILFQGQTAVGRVADNGASVSLVGPRAVVLLAWAR